MQNDVQETTGRPADEVKPSKTEYASPTEIFFHRLGEEIYKRNLPFLNEVLRQLLTMSVSLLGGTMVFLGDDLCSRPLKLSALAMFFVAMLFALFGVMPYRENVPMNMPYEVEASVERAIWRKDFLVCATAAFLIMGFVMAFLGLLLK